MADDDHVLVRVGSRGGDGLREPCEGRVSPVGLKLDGDGRMPERLQLLGEARQAPGAVPGAGDKGEGAHGGFLSPSDSASRSAPDEQGAITPARVSGEARVRSKFNRSRWGRPRCPLVFQLTHPDARRPGDASVKTGVSDGVVAPRARPKRKPRPPVVRPRKSREGAAGRRYPAGTVPRTYQALAVRRNGPDGDPSRSAALRLKRSRPASSSAPWKRPRLPTPFANGYQRSSKSA